MSEVGRGERIARQVSITDNQIFCAGSSDGSHAVIQIGSRAAKLEKRHVAEFIQQLAGHVGLQITIHSGIIRL